MKQHRWLMVTGFILLTCSGLLYLLHYLLFHQGDQILFWFLMDIAFVPVQVFLVALVIDRALHWHDTQAKLSKLNMVIGTFFTELGTKLLGDLTAGITNRDTFKPLLDVRGDWTPQHFRHSLAAVRSFEYQVDADLVDLPALRRLLAAKRDLLLMLLANPNLLEHERFTDLLWAVFHLLEELSARGSLENLPKSDRDHLAGDIRRAYSHLAAEWLLYCEHLAKSYPYIFSIVVRTHPLRDDPCATVQ